MQSGQLIAPARRRAGLTQREAGGVRETSHATLAAYETGTKVPRVDTLDRILRAAGYVPEVGAAPRADSSPSAREAKGRGSPAVLARRRRSRSGGAGAPRAAGAPSRTAKAS